MVITGGLMSLTWTSLITGKAWFPALSVAVYLIVCVPTLLLSISPIEVTMTVPSTLSFAVAPASV